MVSERKGHQGRVYREFNGRKYWLQRKRGIYMSQIGGRTKLLHIDLWEHVNGPIPARHVVVPDDGDKDNFDLARWKCVPMGDVRKNKGNKRPGVLFCGRWYYPDRRGYFFHKKSDGETLSLHREVWEQERGKIPDGWHVHHKNEDKGDNRIENLECLSAQDHLSLHGYTSPWVGSAANLEQLDSLRDKAAEWHCSPEGLAWHSEHGRKSWEGRQSFDKTCQHCGSEYKTPFPTRSKYCSQSCRSLAGYYAKKRSQACL